MIHEGYYLVELQNYYNADAISYDQNPGDGKLGMLTCYPAEELPESNSIYEVAGIPFVFPSKEENELNNIECFNQEIWIEPAQYSTAYFVGTGDNGSFLERIQIITELGVKEIEVGLSNCVDKVPYYQEEMAFCGTHLHSSEGDIPGICPHLWMQSVELMVEKPIQKLILPDNPCFHIFSITLKKGGK